jgi:hypothetical protein
MQRQEFFTSRWALILATLGMAIGAGNIWYLVATSVHGNARRDDIYQYLLFDIIVCRFLITNIHG